jgi:hypothetical protein
MVKGLAAPRPRPIGNLATMVVRSLRPVRRPFTSALIAPLGAAGPGRHEAQVQMPRGLRPGVYWVRLTQSGRYVRRSVVLMP